MHAFEHHQFGLANHSVHRIVEIQLSIYQCGPAACVYEDADHPITLQ
jgi:hypothetical protein